MRQQHKLTRGRHDAFFQGTVTCPDGKVRMKFLVLDEKQELTENIATLRKYTLGEVQNILKKKDIEMCLNTKFSVIVNKNTYNELLTITEVFLKSFITPKWYVEHSENWQGSKNGERNSETKAKYLKEREAKDKRFALIGELRKIQNQGLAGELPNDKCEKLFGIDYQGLRKHIEGTFKGSMHWLNRGKVWHLDHIKPLVSFDLTQKSELLKAIHYTNLQALTIEENIAKSDHYFSDTEEEDNNNEKFTSQP
jgi:hypothetical protein